MNFENFINKYQISVGDDINLKNSVLKRMLALSDKESYKDLAAIYFFWDCARLSL